MSSQPAITKSESIDTDWQQVDQLVTELAQLAQSDLTPQEYYRTALQGIVHAVDAVGGAIWTVTPDGTVQMAHQFSSTSQQTTDEHESWRLNLAQFTGEAKKPQGFLPAEQTAEPLRFKNQSEFRLLYCPWFVNETTAGIIEIWHRPEQPSEIHQGCIPFIEAVAELFAEFTKQQRFKLLENHQQLWNQYVRFSETIHDHLTPRDVAYQIANEGRLVVDCDRLSVAVLRGRTCRLLAISGVDSIHRRASTTRRLEKLTEGALRMNEPLWYEGTSDEMPPQINALLQAYIDTSHARRLAIIPLEQAKGHADRVTPRPVGALIVEWFHGEIEETAKQRLALVVPSSAIALRNAESLRTVPLFKFLRWFGNLRFLRAARQLPLTLLILSLAATVLAAFVFVPYDFTVEAPFQLQPVTRQQLFAPTNGIVTTLHVEHGQDVEANEEVAVITDDLLDLEFRRVWGDLQTIQKQLAAVEADRLTNQQGRRDARHQYNQLTAEQQELKEKLDSLQAQYAILEKRKEELMIISPIAGQILTWDLERKLQHRPVRRGQRLMTVAHTTGSWILEAHFADRDMGHILRAQERSDEILKVSYVLASEPDLVRTGHVQKIGLTTDIDVNDRPSVQVKIELDPTQPRPERPGLTGIAKIHCGSHCLGYVLFHDLIDTLRTKILF